MTKKTVTKTHTQKDGTVWEWSETSELKTQLAELKLNDKPIRK